MHISSEASSALSHHSSSRRSIVHALPKAPWTSLIGSQTECFAVTLKRSFTTPLLRAKRLESLFAYLYSRWVILISLAYLPLLLAVTMAALEKDAETHSDNTDNLAADGLKHLGYQQELTRSRGLFHILFMTIAIMAVPFGLAAPIATSLTSGGHAVMIWGWVLVSFASQPLAMSLAEICSKYPTSAGAYYWCFRLTSPRRRLLSSWINGWLTMVGVWTVSLSVTFGTAQILVAGVRIFQPGWVPTVWLTYLVFLGVATASTLVGVFLNKILPLIDVICAWWTALGVIIMLVCLSAKAASGRHSASFVFGHFDASVSGWTPGWSFFIGLLPVAYTYAANGMVASMAEEVHNPSVQLPRALVWSIPIGFVVGIIFLLPILFTLPDIQTLLAVPGGQPTGVLFELIMGSKGGGFAMWLIVFGIGMFCAISTCCAASRATWSFARDGAIPFPKIWAKVNHSLGDVPLNAYLLSLIIQLLLGLIFLGSSAAFNAFIGVAVMCLGASYAMPVAISLWNGRREMEDAPFGLGRWGWFINLFAVMWTAFQIVLFSIPAVVPVTQMSMNYASVVFVGFAVISAVWFMINGRWNYRGPPLPSDIVESQKADGGLHYLPAAHLALNGIERK